MCSREWSREFCGAAAWINVVEVLRLARASDFGDNTNTSVSAETRQIAGCAHRLADASTLRRLYDDRQNNPKRSLVCEPNLRFLHMIMLTAAWASHRMLQSLIRPAGKLAYPMQEEIPLVF